MYDVHTASVVVFLYSNLSECKVVDSYCN